MYSRCDHAVPTEVFWTSCPSISSKPTKTRTPYRVVKLQFPLVQLTTEQYSTSNHIWVSTCQEANAINLKCGLRRTCSESLNHHLPKSSTSFRSRVVILMNHSQQHAVRFIVNLYIIHFYITNFFHMFGSPTRKGLDKNIFSIHPRRQSLKVLKRKQKININRWVVDPYDSYDFVQQR